MDQEEVVALEEVETVVEQEEVVALVEEEKEVDQEEVVVLEEVEKVVEVEKVEVVEVEKGWAEEGMAEEEEEEMHYLHINNFGKLQMGNDHSLYNYQYQDLLRHYLSNNYNSHLHCPVLMPQSIRNQIHMKHKEFHNALVFPDFRYNNYNNHAHSVYLHKNPNMRKYHLLQGLLVKNRRSEKRMMLHCCI